MSRRHYDLPPFATLSAFEAAARHLSFKNAAQELGVTPGAISHQIKALEAELGAALFERRHRGVELTHEGAALFETLVTSFGQMSRQLARIRRVSDGMTVTVGSTTAVAALWLSPAAIDFWGDHPEININQVTQDRPFRSAQGFDFLISYGKSQITSLSHTALYRDELVPLASPERAEVFRGHSLSELSQEWLIHLETTNPSWTTWPEWFQAQGHRGEVAAGTKVTNYSVALQIASQGAGIVLGWRRLARSLIDSKQLAVIDPHATPAPQQFYLAGLKDKELTKCALVFKNWLVDKARRH